QGMLRRVERRCQSMACRAWRAARASAWRVADELPARERNFRGVAGATGVPARFSAPPCVLARRPSQGLTNILLRRGLRDYIPHVTTLLSHTLASYHA